MLKFVKDVSEQYNGTAEVYELDDSLVVISTVNIDALALDPGERALTDMVGMLTGLPTSGEETMVFSCDRDGEVTDWCEVAMATGPGSRSKVIEQLSKEAS